MNRPAQRGASAPSGVFGSARATSPPARSWICSFAHGFHALRGKAVLGEVFTVWATILWEWPRIAPFGAFLAAPRTAVGDRTLGHRATIVRHLDGLLLRMSSRASGTWQLLVMR